MGSGRNVNMGGNLERKVLVNVVLKEQGAPLELANLGLETLELPFDLLHLPSPGWVRVRFSITVRVRVRIWANG